ncbi:MAG: LysR family transcriptional regulator [Erysipelotrichaceae bacterium]|nr:LysR family transcriptional regulator [Erysipelotrichaceae bacterium]
MNNFNLNLFKYFYYVVYYNGFTNASKNLNIAQSSLSYNIKQLELQLDKILIIRNNKNFELTEDGYNLYENLKSAFSILNKNLEQFNNQNAMELTIGVRHYLSDFIFRDSIVEFINMYPNVHINLKLYSKLDVKKFDDEYDIVIDYEDYTNLINSTNKDLLCTLSNIFVSGKELSKNYETVHSIKQLANTKLISMCPNKRNGKFQKMCFENGILFENIISVNDSMISKKLVKNNLGLCFANKEFFKEELVRGDIKEIKISENVFDDNIYIVYKKCKNLNNIVKFINILKKQYEEEL